MSQSALIGSSDDHARFRITENPAYCRLRPKTRKRIRIPQPPTASRCSCHPSLMPNTTPPKCKIPLQSPGLWSLQPLKSPTRFYEDPLLYCRFRRNLSQGEPSRRKTRPRGREDAQSARKPRKTVKKAP